MNEVIEGTIDDQPPKPSQALAVTPAQMLAVAVNQGADLAKLEKLMELQERWEANEARKAYNAAVAEFKKNPPDIIKDKENKQYGSKYATLANLVNNGSAALAPFGLTVEWKIDQSSQIKVTCILKHALGHSEQVSITGAPDDSGAKNKLQQIKSTITYLKGETFQCVTGITARDCPGDNDGNGAGKPKKAAQSSERRESEPLTPEQEVAAREERKRGYFIEAYNRNEDTVLQIKERIAFGDLVGAAKAWYDLSQEDQLALYIAPTKAGEHKNKCFTTAQRDIIKTEFPKNGKKAAETHGEEE